jgi:hypothetical protein
VAFRLKRDQYENGWEHVYRVVGANAQFPIFRFFSGDDE